MNDICVGEEDPRSVIINISDAENYISSNEVIDNILPSDVSIDLIGIVKDIQDINTINKNNTVYNVFNFTVECQNELRLPVVVWDEDIQRIKPYIAINNIIHIDNPFAKPQSASKWTNGKDFILTCRSNTIVNTLGKVMSIKSTNNNDNTKTFDDIQIAMEEKEIISLNVVLKSIFRKEKGSRFIGTVTDCKCKLTVYANNYESSIKYEKGQWIKITGKFINQNKVYFEIDGNSIVQLQKDKLSIESLDGINKTPKRNISFLQIKSETNEQKKSKLSEKMEKN